VRHEALLQVRHECGIRHHFYTLIHASQLKKLEARQRKTPCYTQRKTPCYTQEQVSCLLHASHLATRKSKCLACYTQDTLLHARASVLLATRKTPCYTQEQVSCLLHARHLLRQRTPTTVPRCAAGQPCQRRLRATPPPRGPPPYPRRSPGCSP
jgi:hypothetical protein